MAVPTEEAVSSVCPRPQAMPGAPGPGALPACVPPHSLGSLEWGTLVLPRACCHAEREHGGGRTRGRAFEVVERPCRLPLALRAAHVAWLPQRYSQGPQAPEATLDPHGVVLCLWSRRYSQGRPPRLWCSVAEGL